MSLYRTGQEVLGAGTGRAILIKVRDPAALARREGGAMASLIDKLAPDTLEAKIYDEMQKRIRMDFAQGGVDAEVAIVFSDLRQVSRPVEIGTILRDSILSGIVGAVVGAVGAWTLAKARR